MIIMYLSIPYFVVTNFAMAARFPWPNHPLHKGQKNTGHKHIFFAKDYPLEAIKNKCREAKVSIHEAVMTTISLTMKEYWSAETRRPNRY